MAAETAVVNRKTIHQGTDHADLGKVTPSPSEVFLRKFAIVPIASSATRRELVQVLSNPALDFLGEDVQRKVGAALLRRYLDGAQDMVDEFEDPDFSLPPVYLYYPKDQDERHEEDAYIEPFFSRDHGLLFDVRWLEFFARNAKSTRELRKNYYLRLEYAPDNAMTAQWTPMQEAYLGGREEAHHAYVVNHPDVAWTDPLDPDVTRIDQYDAQIHELLALHALYAYVKRQFLEDERWLPILAFYAGRINLALRFLKHTGGDYETALNLVPRFAGELVHTVEEVETGSFEIAA